MPPLPGYPHPAGSKEESVFEVAGPNPYAAIVAGPPVSGGHVVSAREAGLHTFDSVNVEGGMSTDGTYIVMVLNANSANRPMTHVHLRWIVTATGVEAGAIDLSASRVRLRATGNH